MHVNYPKLERQVGVYLRSRKGQAIFDSIESPVWAKIVVTLMLLVMSLVMLPTIKWTLESLKCLRSIFCGETFRDPWAHLRQQPELLRPLIGAGIIIGRQGYGLVLGTFDDQIPLHLLARKANELAAIYSDGASNSDEDEIVELLHDDAYQSNRRRRVVEPQAEGCELYLFDMQIKMDELSPGPSESVLIACVATAGEKGRIEQIPWHTVVDAVTE